MKKCIIGMILKLCIAIFLINVSNAFANPKESENPKNNSTIRFATEATYPPVVTMDAKGNIGGFETELVSMICKEANVNCSFQHLPFDSLFLSLDAKKIDAVYGGVGITERRKDQVLFSQALYKMPVGFIYTKNKDKENEQNFQDKTIGVQQGTAGFELYLKKHYPNAKIKTYASIQDALLDLQNKRIQAVFGDIPVFTYWLAHKNTPNNPSQKQEAKQVNSYLSSKISPESNFGFLALNEKEVSEFSQGSGIAVRKTDVELMNKLNAAFDKLVANGAVNKLKEQYGMIQQ